MPRKPGPRAAALAAGEPNYFTGRPCCNDHIAPRNSWNGRCFKCSRIEIRERVRRKHIQRQCVICDDPLLNIKRRKTCSEECGRIHYRNLRREANRRNCYLRNPLSPERKQRKYTRRKEKIQKAFAALRALEELGIEI